MTLLALVPVRGGSKGLPGKNLMKLAGKPLYRHAVDQGLEAGAEVVISTDIEELLAADHGPEVSAIRRPADLAGDDVPMDPVIRHALRDRGEALVVLLQATSPLRRASDIRAALEVWRKGGADLVMSVARTPSSILKYGLAEGSRFVPVARPEYCFMNRQSLPAVFRPNGAVYVFDAEWFRANGGLATDRIGMVEMPEDRSFDIDTAEDFARVEAILTA